MFRKRLRPKYSVEEFSEVYSVKYDFLEHPEWLDHHDRAEKTLKLANEFINGSDRTGADLSAGSGYFAKNLPQVDWILGDLDPGHDYTGFIENTIHDIPFVDVFMCFETLEHLDDPDMVLELIRWKAGKLLLSTPLGESSDGNPQHYWGWDDEAMGSMLRSAGWGAHHYVETNPVTGYTFQIWGCD